MANNSANVKKYLFPPSARRGLFGTTPRANAAKQPQQRGINSKGFAAKLAKFNRTNAETLTQNNQAVASPSYIN